MKILTKIFIIFTIITLAYNAKSQNCIPTGAGNCQDVTLPGTSRFIQTPSPNNVDFVFDNLSKYLGGIIYSGSTVLKLEINQNNAACQWRLIMYIDNNGALGNNWDGSPYNPLATGGIIPTIDLLEVKIYNNCNTSTIDRIYQSFPAILTDIDIINDAVQNFPANCNNAEVNTAGSYITNYGEYTFTVDYRIKFDISTLFLRPGNYNLTLKFCLVEE